MNNWYIKNIKEDYISLSEKLNLNTILTKVLVNRGFKDINDIHKPLRDFKALYGINSVCHYIYDALKDGEHIRIIGDYDIDGVCSTYIFENTLNECVRRFENKSIISSRIPNRLRDGYGLNTNLIEEAHNDGVKTIVTCDNGIKAFEAVDLANKYGIKVIITDHHEPDEKLPNAIAICDPKIEDFSHVFTDICGAVVAFKICQYLRENILNEKDSLKNIDFAAFATIGDVMPLIDENRFIVIEGLKHINNTSNIGLRTLIENLGYGYNKPVDAKALGFFIGPCINAAGRLRDASIAYNLFKAKNQSEANLVVSELIWLNEERKKLTKYYTDVAKSYIDQNKDNDILVAYCKGCPEGIVGNISGKLKEEYGKPVIVITDYDKGIKGSGRSVTELDLNQKCNNIKDIFTTFGGHKGAVGFTIETNDVSGTIYKLTELLNNNSENNIYSEGVEIDMILPFKYIDMRLAREIEMLEPYGNKFPEPLFADKYVAFSKGVVLGKNRNLFKTKVTQDNISLDAIIIGDGDLLQSLLPYDLWDITFNITINRYNGNETLQLQIQHYKPS